MHFQFSGDVPAALRLWSLSEDVLVEDDDTGDGSLVVVTWWGEFSIRDASFVVRESLRRMSLGPISLQHVTSTAGSDDIAALKHALNLLSGSVVHSLGSRDGQVPLLSAIPLAPEVSFRPRAIATSRPVRLSRFAMFRSCNGELVLECPRARFRVILHQPSTRHVATLLVAPLSISRIASSANLSPSAVADIVAYLVAAGVGLVGGHDARFSEDSDPVLRQWEHHELLFHVRSRSRKEDGPPDEAVRHAAEVTSPATKPTPPGPRFPLYRPDTPAAGDAPSLTELLEADHACPEPTTRTMTAEQLGELLFRSARIRSTGKEPLPPDVSRETSQRPYFSIASLYELELYLGANRCTGLRRGLYHYDPREHALTLINDHERDLAELLDTSMTATGGTRRPSAVLTMAARPERTSWALGGASYATTLMHLGALQQTLYLTAREMGLSARAVPVDTGDRTDRILGLDWPAEVTVGECVVDFPS